MATQKQKVNKKTPGYQIYRLHIKLIRTLNDTHIFLQQALPSLQLTQENLAGSAHKKDRRYYTPKMERRGLARRRDSEVAKILERFIDRELYENLVITAVSKLEAYLADAVFVVMQRYPKKLGIFGESESQGRTVPIEVVLRAESNQEVLEWAIRKRCEEMLYYPPRKYLSHLGQILSFELNDSAFDRFIEIKATRDILVHNSGIANQIYVEKAGPLARAQEGEPLLVDQSYFDVVITVLKRVSGIVVREAQAKFSQ